MAPPTQKIGEFLLFRQFNLSSPICQENGPIRVLVFNVNLCHAARAVAPSSKTLKSQAQGEETWFSPERAGKYPEALLNICTNMQRREKGDVNLNSPGQNNIEPGSDILLSKCLRDHKAIPYSGRQCFLCPCCQRGLTPRQNQDWEFSLTQALLVSLSISHWSSSFCL